MDYSKMSKKERRAGEMIRDAIERASERLQDKAAEVVQRAQISNDSVNQPRHYTSCSGVECIDAISAAVEGKSGIEAVCVANVIKYVWRCEKKGGLEDVKKARWYLDRLIKTMEGEL